MLRAIFTLGYEIHGNGDGCLVFKQGMRFNFGTFAYFAQQIDQIDPNPHAKTET